MTKLIRSAFNPIMTSFDLQGSNGCVKSGKKLIREKRHWEHRILKLGGPNYMMSNKMLDSEGKELTWNKGLIQKK